MRRDPGDINCGKHVTGNAHQIDLKGSKYSHPKNRIMGRILILILLLPLSAFAQIAQTDPLTLPTRDSHQNLLIVADPYLTADRYKGTFGKKSPHDAGIVAIDVYFRNDNDAPIRINPDTIELVVSPPDEQRQRLAPFLPKTLPTARS